MRWIALTALTFSSLCLASFTAAAEPLVWGVKAENLEYRLGKGPKNLFAWDTEAFVGSDELKFVWRSEGEFETQADAFETLENQLLLQTPISTFFDAVAGVRAETPKGPDRLSGVIGIKGLSKQWFDVEADLFLSEYPAARLAIDYEGLLTNRIILTPSIEVNLRSTMTAPVPSVRGDQRSKWERASATISLIGFCRLTLAFTTNEPWVSLPNYGVPKERVIKQPIW